MRRLIHDFSYGIVEARPDASQTGGPTGRRARRTKSRTSRPTAGRSGSVSLEWSAPAKRRGARCELATSAPGEASSPGYFFPIATVAVPVGETQPEDEISVTESETEPLAPAVNVTWLVPCPAVIEPFETLQE